MADVCSWDWQAIGGIWQGCATLVVGVGAVIGAYRIGNRQITLSRKQTEIQIASLNEALFDRRLRVYQAALRYLLEGRGGDGYVSAETTDQFTDALLTAPFLFDESVVAFMKQIEPAMAHFNIAAARFRGGEGIQRSSEAAKDDFIDTAEIISDLLRSIIVVFENMTMLPIPSK